MPPALPDSFAATEAWLLEQPGRATAGGVRKRRPVAPDLSRHTANRVRRATPENPGWQPARWRARHKLTGRIRRGTDRRAALVRFRSHVRDSGLPWVAKLDIASFFDAIPHGPLLAALRQHVASRRLEREVAGYLAWYWQARWPDWPAATPLPGDPVGVPQGSPISGVLANVFLTAFDRSLERAGIVFLRSLDDVTILAASPAALGTAKSGAPWQATGGGNISGPVAGSTSSSATSSPAGMPAAQTV